MQRGRQTVRGFINMIVHHAHNAKSKRRWYSRGGGDGGGHEWFAMKQEQEREETNPLTHGWSIRI